MLNAFESIKKNPRIYLPENFTITTWEELEPYFKELSERPISSRKELEKWLKDMSELEAVISEDACWRQIKMTCDTTDKSLEDCLLYTSDAADERSSVDL